MERIDFKTPIIIFLLCMLGILVTASLSSCSPKIYNKPTRREINKAMRYSTWEYEQPRYDMTPKQFYK